MTIKTLERIHRLLKEEYDQIERAYQLARKNANDAEEDNADNACALRELELSLFHKRQEARRALDEFEDHEFS